MDIEKQNKLFFNKIAKYYDFVFGNWIRKMQLGVIRHAEIREGARVLDAGCGTGNLLALLENYNLELYGIDISKEMLKIARKKLKKAKLKLGSVEKLNFKNDYFDYIFSIDAFHHYSDKEKAIKSFHRVLKKRGKLIIVDLDFGKHLNNVFQKIEPGNNGIYTKSEMKDIFGRNGFRVIRRRKVGMFTIMSAGMKC